jgi:mono/diheme cytochrome c family protein
MRFSGLILLLLLFTACTGAQEESPAPETVVVETTPPTTTPVPTTAAPLLENIAEAEELFESKCGECHPLNYPATRGSRSHMAWKGTVNEMIENGANVTDEEAELIAKYLATLYGA